MGEKYRYCPRCGAEYHAHIEQCADCGIELVSTKPTTEELQKARDLYQVQRVREAEAEVKAEKEHVSLSRYIIAVAVCGAIGFLYVLLNVAMGWEYGGGILMQVIVFGSIVAIWKVITRKKQIEPSGEPQHSNSHGDKGMQSGGES